MSKRNIINFLAICLFCLYSTQAKEVCYISSYNGKVLPTTIWHPPNNHLFTSYLFLKLENIKHSVSLYDKNRKEIGPTVEISQKEHISVYGTLQKLC
ncbi:hypothetical protein [Chryseobacterium aurantiacum]|uniref:hypothetical protein n=1 Tax=Chryseobacterium aurantiacum TaxID=2116499 RepID=UPI000D11CDD2|nr:hypothetical protein [Chryseobacterium aurantiacum]